MFVCNQFVAAAVRLHRDRGLEEAAMFQSYPLLYQFRGYALAVLEGVQRRREQEMEVGVSVESTG